MSRFWYFGGGQVCWSWIFQTSLVVRREQDRTTNLAQCHQIYLWPRRSTFWTISMRNSSWSREQPMKKLSSEKKHSAGLFGFLETHVLLSLAAHFFIDFHARHNLRRIHATKQSHEVRREQFTALVVDSRHCSTKPLSIAVLVGCSEHGSKCEPI